MPDQFEMPEDITPRELAGALFGKPVSRQGRRMVNLEIAEPDESNPDWTPLRRVDGDSGDGDADGGDRVQ